MSEDSDTTAPPETTQRVSSYFFLIIFVTLIIAFVCLAIVVYGLSGYKTLGDLTLTGEAIVVFLLIGFIGVSFSTYMLVQTRRRVMQLSLELPPVMSTITCQKCGFKNQREFERGDYIFKEAGPCPKCNEKLLISSVYREVKEKPKKEIF
jgi:hypothetical protein